MSLQRQVMASPLPGLDARRSFGGQMSMVVRGGEFLFVGGLTAVDPDSGERIRGTTMSETRRILANIKLLLEAAGSSLNRVVKVNVLLQNMLEAPDMNEAFAGFFPEPPPARTVCGACLPHGARVIIECTALA